MDDQTNQTKYEKRNLADLKNWEGNPRSIKDSEYERLQEHIRRLGVYKPLLINQNNIVLGGNMRLNALRDLGISEVMCAIVLTDNTTQMIEYALSDNEQMGSTDEDKLAELITLNPIKTELFAIQTGKLKPLQNIIDSRGPGGAENQEQKCHRCPLHCGMDNL